MKRNMDLIRKMVLLIEDHPTGWAPEVKMEGYTADQIGYHSYLLVDSGLAVGANLTDSGDSGPCYSIMHLTSAGHDFADSARNQYVWNEVTEDIKEKGLPSVTLDILKKMLDKAIRKRLDAD
ncbi:MAG: DUF2513 domain-containing protein [Isosphaeraceae bacterium]